jgi:regulator of sigma E protease
MTLIYFLIVIGILVFVHELGHFLMAKQAGVRVEKFSLGMGPKLFGYKKGDTEYVISALPLGGYVKMAGENPDEEPTGAPDEFQNKSVWQRAKIVATGPLTNILLAFLIMPCVFMVAPTAKGRKGGVCGEGIAGRARGLSGRRRYRRDRWAPHQRLDQGDLALCGEPGHGPDRCSRTRR